MGQGTYTSIAMILAEELDADFSKVALLHAPPNDKFYGNPIFDIQATGNSNSIRAWWKPLRSAGASARACWSRPPPHMAGRAGELHGGEREVIHAGSGRKLAYGALAEAAGGGRRQKMCRSRTRRTFGSDRQAAEAAGYAGQGQRQGRLRHRRDAARA